jgi:hypothetical protein
MSLYGAFDKTKHLEELNDPLFTNEGVKSPSTRKTEARAALGVQSTAEVSTAITAALSAGIADARFTAQPLVTRTVTAVNATATMTAASLLGGIITSTTAAAVAGTLPLAADLEVALLAAHPSLGVGDTIEFIVLSTGANAFTVTTNTGWTLVGDMVVETATNGRYMAIRTAADTYTLYRA